jgi:L-alanine-DL-glutamate epimerase-like enolase superfamily enzyme
MDLGYYQFTLALRYPFAISRHTYNTIHTTIVELSEGSVTGYGEATTNPYYGVTEENLNDILNQAGIHLKNYEFRTPEKLYADLSFLMDQNTFAQSALDCAAHDLYNKLKGKTFMSRWGISYEKYPLTSYTLGIGTARDLKTKIQDLQWPIYKLKVAGKNSGKIIRNLRGFTDALIRVDANCSWHPEYALALAEEMNVYGVEFIEQPFKAGQYKETEELKKNCPVSIIADESCRIEEDLEMCSEAFDGINIKLSKCGGLTPAMKMVEQARKKGLKIMIGCMTETTVGISAAAQLLPFVDYADLDGPLLLAEDVAT